MALCASFGSVARWQQDFAGLAAAHAGQNGHVALVWDGAAARLLNQWQSVAAAPTGHVLLALPVQVPADFDAIEWAAVYERYQHVVHEASEGAACLSNEAAGALMIDVRRDAMFNQATHMIQGATWRNPAEVGEWAGSLASSERVVVYCIYGHEVGRATALRLRANGVNAQFLEGGFEGWQQASCPVQARVQGTD